MGEIILEAFENFRTQLDCKHNLHEIIVKRSRDVTVQSKRLIFLLHRIKTPQDKEKLFKEAKIKLDAILKSWKDIAQLLISEDSQAYKRAYTAGLQEFIEAAEFLNYIENEDKFCASEIHYCLLGINKIRDKLLFNLDLNGEKIQYQISVPISDYLLGLADVTGEAMRMCIAAAANANKQEATCQSFSYHRAFKLSSYIDVMHSAFANFSVGFGSNKYYKDKLSTMASSLQKVEDVCYSLKLQKQEEMLLHD